MPKNKKYQFQIQQVNTTWNAQIIRQITSKKTGITKQQAGFATESAAQAWAESELKELLNTLADSNKRHDGNRKVNQEKLQERSARRADKTALVKANKEEQKTSRKTVAKKSEGLDPEVDYNFDEYLEQD